MLLFPSGQPDCTVHEDGQDGKLVSRRADFQEITTRLPKERRIKYPKAPRKKQVDDILAANPVRERDV